MCYIEASLKLVGIISGSKMNKRQASAFLDVVPKGKEFYLVNGEKISSLREFRNVLHVIDDDLFRYHVNEHHNDFAKWILEVIKDTVLAQKIEFVRDKEKMISIVDKRVDDLLSVLEKEYHRKMREYSRETQKPEKHLHTENYYHKREERLKEKYSDLVVREFFYGMAAGIFITFLLL